MRSNFSLRDLEIFHAIATTGSTRQAAMQLQVTQSAVSHALARLEESLKIRLFTRENQRLQITAAGRYMLNESVQMMGNLARIEEDIFGLMENGATSLKMGFAPGLGLRFGPRLVQQYLIMHPGIAVSMDVAASGHLIAEVEAGRMDMALVAYDIHEPNLFFTQVVSARMRVLVSSESPLAQKEEIEPNDLNDQLMIKPIQSDRLVYRNDSSRRMMRHELQSSLSSIGAMVELTGGVSLVNAITAADHCEHSTLRSLPFAQEQWFNFYLVYKHELKSNRLIKDVQRALNTVVEAMLQREDCRQALRLPTST